MRRCLECGAFLEEHPSNGVQQCMNCGALLNIWFGKVEKVLEGGENKDG